MDTQLYYSCYTDYFWKWEEEGSVLAIPGGNTIAYREHVSGMIDVLAPQGLPPFGSLLLAIVATNQDAIASIRSVYEWVHERVAPDDTILDSAISFLTLLSQVPHEYKLGLMRATLLAALFDKCHNSISAKRSAALKSVIATEPMMQFVTEQKCPDASFRKDFRTIALLGEKFRTVDDILRQLKSLPDLPKAIELPEEEEPMATKPDFVEELICNPKTFHLGTLIRRIWSGLNIPFHAALPSSQPLGGISDITNKGDFDKLLVSEFANDDLALLTRLANNEALYLHREIPPAQETMRRTILIDVSLKNWGSPKTIAFATAIALARHPKNKMRCDIYAVGKQVTPIYVDSITDIVNGLQIVDGGLHASEGLESFFESHPADSNNELFFITEPTTLRQSALLKTLHDHNRIHYWVFTDHLGNLDLYKKQHRSRKHLLHLQIPLREIWGYRQEENLAMETAKDIFPLLFKTPNKYNKVCVAGDDVFIIAGRELYRSYGQRDDQQPDTWDLICRQLPQGATWEVGINENGTCVVLAYNNQNKTITLLDLAKGSSIQVNFDAGDNLSREFISYGSCFYFLDRIGEALCIHMDGTITHAGAATTGMLRQYSDTRKNKFTRVASDNPPLRHIHDVYISKDGALVFNNTHKLATQRNGTLMLSTAKAAPAKHVPPDRDINSVREDQVFTFPDGSTIEVFRAGLLKLRSGEASIPTIYITSFTNKPLGAATDDYFAGNKLFNKSLPVLTVQQFYDHYIQQFITHIQQRSR